MRHTYMQLIRHVPKHDKWPKKAGTMKSVNTGGKQNYGIAGIDNVHLKKMMPKSIGNGNVEWGEKRSSIHPGIELCCYLALLVTLLYFPIRQTFCSDNRWVKEKKTECVGGHGRKKGGTQREALVGKCKTFISFYFSEYIQWRRLTWHSLLSGLLHTDMSESCATKPVWLALQSEVPIIPQSPATRCK